MKIKIIILIFVIFLVNINFSFSHKEWVHQYLTKEAYKYLENEFGEITELKNYLGLDYFGASSKVGQWSSYNSIAIGSWREDLDDIIWEHSLFDGWNESINHFWSADNGDNYLTNIPAYGEVPNAWMKAKILCFGAYYNNNFTFFDFKPTVLYAERRYRNTLGLYRKYLDLFDFIKTKAQLIYGYKDLTGVKRSLNPTYQRYISMETKRWPYNIVGRICHLLQDMSVPAHVHNDMHACKFNDGDQFELWVASNDVGDCNQEHQTFRAQNFNNVTAREQGGLLWEIFSMPNETAIRYLFYTLNQLADHYPSWDIAWPEHHVDAQGDNNLSNGTNPKIEAYYTDIGNPPNLPMLDESSDILLNFAIRATATLLYWFSVKSELITCPEILYMQNYIYYGSQEPYITKFKAINKIIAGKNVKINLPEGSVINKVNSKSEYIAKNEIDLKDGFIAEKGSKFHAYLSSESCNLISNSIINTQNNYTKPMNILSETSNTYSSIDIYIPTSALISGDTVNNLYITNFFEIYPHRMLGDSISDTVETFDDIIFYSDSIRVYLRDSLSNDSLIISMNDSSLFKVHLDIADSNQISISKDSYSIFHNSDKHSFNICIYPNPTSSNNISYSYYINNSDYLTINIIDIFGNIIKKICFHKFFSKGMVHETINCSNIPNGLYFIIVTTSNEISSKMFIINK